MSGSDTGFATSVAIAFCATAAPVTGNVMAIGVLSAARQRMARRKRRVTGNSLLQNRGARSNTAKLSCVANPKERIVQCEAWGFYAQPRPRLTPDATRQSDMARPAQENSATALKECAAAIGAEARRREIETVFIRPPVGVAPCRAGREVLDGKTLFRIVRHR